MEYIADPFGFPMVWVQEARAWVHCLPVTHVQLDMFRERGGQFREGQDKPVPIKDLEAHNYTRAFATRVEPDDARKLARCFEDMTGDQFRLPSPAEWHTVYRVLAGRSFSDELTEMMSCCRDRARSLAKRLHEILAGPVQDSVSFKLKLADRMLFRLGVMEWVRLPSGTSPARGGEYAGMGLPAQHSWASLSDPELLAPVRPRRNQPTPPFGFRLWRNSFPEQTHA